MAYYTSINGGQLILSSSVKSAVSKGLQAARNGNQVEFFEDSKDGKIDCEKATERLEKLLHAEPKEKKLEEAGNVDIHNALIQMGILCNQLAKASLQRPLKEEELNGLSAAWEEVEISANVG